MNAEVNKELVARAIDHVDRQRLVKAGDGPGGHPQSYR